MLKRLILALALALAAAPAAAEDRAFGLAAPEALVASGLLDYLLPRFSLKTGVRITLGAAPAQAGFGTEGTPVFRRGDTLWHLSHDAGPGPQAFEDWLLSDVGKRTVETFVPAEGAAFAADVGTVARRARTAPEGDAARGEEVALLHCGRCHVVNDSNRMNTIASTPSFALMRTFADWQNRFESFFVLKPHAAFTQVADVTEPFDAERPSPIAPVEVTLEEIEAITAYVGTIPPADLGAPIRSQ